MKYERKTLSESFQQVESARPIIHPNEGFVAQLEQFEKELEALQGLENATERINCQVIWWKRDKEIWAFSNYSIKLKILRIIISF